MKTSIAIDLDENQVAALRTAGLLDVPGFHLVGSVQRRDWKEDGQVYLKCGLVPNATSAAMRKIIAGSHRVVAKRKKAAKP